jgi:transformation/transcription domain-associated protein
VRNTVLDILNRLPTTPALQPYAANLLKLSMFLLEVENEENAVICLRIIIDLHKSYRPMLENDVQPFLDIVQKIYSDLPATVATVFSAKEASKPAGPASGAPPGLGLDVAQPKKATSLIRSTQSFKVLTECPIIVVLLFQLYQRYLQANIPKFMPLIVNTLGLVAPKAALTTHRAAYVDFVAAQVKVSLSSPCPIIAIELLYLSYPEGLIVRLFSELKTSYPHCVVHASPQCAWICSRRSPFLPTCCAASPIISALTRNRSPSM